MVFRIGTRYMIYVINLSKDIERRIFIEQQLIIKNIEFQFIEAIEGNRLNDGDLNIFSNKSIMKLHANEFACILSHQKAWKKFLETKNDWAIFCEDDVHFSSYLNGFLEKINIDTQRVYVLRLETFKSSAIFSSASQPLGNRTIRTMLSNQGGTAGYLINRATAEALIAAVPQMENALDIEMFDPARRFYKDLEILQIDPAICIQDAILNRFNPRLPSNITQRADVDVGLFKEPGRNQVAMATEAMRLIARTVKNWIYSAIYRQRGEIRRVIRFK